MSDDDRPDMPPPAAPAQQVIGYSPAEQAMADELDAKIAALNAAIDERIAALTPSDAQRALAFVRDHLPLVGPALGMLGVAGDKRDKAAEAARLLAEVLELLGV